MSANWTLITVTFNSSEDLRERWSGRDLNGARWIVADNASSDGSADIAESLGAKVIRLSENVGFARANNAALAETDTEYVAFVNPDVAVVSADLERLATTIDSHSAIVAPQLLNPDGSTQPNGRGLPFLVDKFANRGIRLPGSRLDLYVPDVADEPTRVQWFMGAVVCGRADYFRSSGGWDERFFLYYEDHVMGLEASRRGHLVLVDPSSRWTHGWARDTKRFSWRPWMREFASASRFYRMHPYLILPTRRLAERILSRPRRGPSLG